MGNGRPGVLEATCLGHMSEMVSSALLPPIPSLVSGFLSVCPPQGGEGRANLHCGMGAGSKTVGLPEIWPTWPRGYKPGPP